MSAMMFIQLEIILIACLTAVACSVPGTFLVLRKMSMISDAISHSILLGIVAAFLVVKRLDSPLIVLAAALTGLLTVVLVELLIKSKLVKSDAAIGVVYPLMFSVGIILITLYAGNVHLDTDMVLMGELAFAPFNTLVVNGKDLGAVAIYQIGGVMLFNILFVLIFYKELKITIFDPQFSASVGFSPKFMMYALMFIIAVTVVVAFEVAGSIMVVGFIVGPSVISSYFTKRLGPLLLLTPLVGIASCVLGYNSAHLFDVSIAGSIVSWMGILFTLSLIFSPMKGLLVKQFRKNKIKTELAINMLLVHLWQHEVKGDAQIWNNQDTTAYNFNWSADYLRNIVLKSISRNYICLEYNTLVLKDEGKQRAIKAIEK